MSSSPVPGVNIYPYDPSLVSPVIFASIVFASVVSHTAQNFYYRYWRINFFLFYGGVVYVIGLVLRAVSSRSPANLGIYIAATICIYVGPPIYAGAEYNVLGRLMLYLPMHAPLHPRRVKYFFIYIGAVVEALTGAGAGKMAGSRVGTDVYMSGGTLLAISLLLQGAVELVFVTLVWVMHSRAKKAGMLTANVKKVCITLYGCSTLVLLRCIFRAVEAFSQYTGSCKRVYCGGIVTKEWYLYAFEAAPMVLYTLWFNVLHPGLYLPNQPERYLDVDGRTERFGPGWLDGRAKLMIILDPFNALKDSRAGGESTRFWLRPEQWAKCEDGSFARGTASNVTRRARSVRTVAHTDEAAMAQYSGTKA